MKTPKFILISFNGFSKKRAYILKVPICEQISSSFRFLSLTQQMVEELFASLNLCVNWLCWLYSCIQTCQHADAFSRFMRVNWTWNMSQIVRQSRLSPVVNVIQYQVTGFKSNNIWYCRNRTGTTSSICYLNLPSNNLFQMILALRASWHGSVWVQYKFVTTDGS